MIRRSPKFSTQIYDFLVDLPGHSASPMFDGVRLIYSIGRAGYLYNISQSRAGYFYNIRGRAGYLYNILLGERDIYIILGGGFHSPFFQNIDRDEEE